MCNKCFFMTGAIFLFTIFIIFIPFTNWANWISALSTLAMAIIAGFALDTWKNELKYRKRLEIYESLLISVNEIQDFLEHVHEVRQNHNFCKKTLEDFSKILKLSSKKILFIGNTNLSKSVEDISIKMQPYQYFSEANFDGSFCAWYENFIDNYLSNKSNFKDDIDKNLNNIVNLCNEELQKFYK